MRREYLYRDALAVATGGRVEVPVGQDSIDVLRPVGENSAEVVEVKYAANLREALGQVVSYSRRYARANPELTLSRRVHLVTSASPRDAARERDRIEEHREELAEDGITLTTVRERPGVEPVYSVGGMQFASREAIARQLKRVKGDFLIADYLSPAHERFLLDLASAWRRVSHGKPATAISVCSADVHGAGMMMSVHGRVVSPDDCIRPLMMRTHYELLSMPEAV